MATAITDSYIQQIHTARTCIHECFKHAHELLTVRETNLLTELQDIQSKHETDATTQQEELQDLHHSKQLLRRHLRDNDTLNKAIATLNDKMEEILTQSSQVRTIRFLWNTDLDIYLQHAGEIVTSSVTHSTIVPPVIPAYTNMSKPVITYCTHKDTKSDSPRELYFPKGLAIEPQAGQIYLADMCNNRVQVFTSDGGYSFMLNNKMNWPYSISIYDNTVYVSQHLGHCITLYMLDGTFINKVGNEGHGDGQFNHPKGISVSNSGHIYVCDWGNHRFQIIDNNLKFLTYGMNILRCPLDVKLTDKLVIVLDEANPCIHIFTRSDHSLVNSIISSGEGKQIGYSYFFVIDAEVNIIMTDSNNNYVRVFSKSGECISQFGKSGHSKGEFINPTGVAIDKLNRLVVVSENTNHALQIF